MEPTKEDTQEACRCLLAMIQLIFEITYRCPCRCKYCTVSKKDVEMGLGEFITALNLFREYFKGEELAVVLSGGEPSLLPHLKTYVDLARHVGVPVTIVTNGYDPRNVIEARPDLIEVSIDYVGERHDEARGLPGLYHRAISLVKEAVAKGVQVAVRSTVTRDNINDILLLREYLDAIGLRTIPILAMPVRGAPPEVKPTPEQLEKLSSRNGIYVADTCPAGITNFVITPKLEVLPCIFYRKPLGKLTEFTLEELDRIVKEGRKLPRFPCEELTS